MAKHRAMGPAWWNLPARYTKWLHTMWPAGTVEKLPVVNEDGTTNVKGVYVVGDLTGIPLLKFSADTGAKAVRHMLADAEFTRARAKPVEGVWDVVIVGGGVSGMAAALEARKNGLKFVVLEAGETFNTIVNFPKGKPIFTYPTEMKPAGDLQFTAAVKEELVEEIRRQTAGIEPKMARAERIRRVGGLVEVPLVDGRGKATETLKAHRVVIAIGRSGNYRRLGAVGEDSGKVFNRLHDPKEYAGKEVLVVGGGDSAVEAAIAIAQFGGKVTYSYRDANLTRPKPENIERLNMMLADAGARVSIESPKSDRQTTAVGAFMDGQKTPGTLTAVPGSSVKEVREGAVVLATAQGEKTIGNDVVFAMIGREAPLDFFRKSGIGIHGDRSVWWWATLIFSLLLFTFVYHWKKGGVHITGIAAVDQYLDVGTWWRTAGYFPYQVPQWLAGVSAAFTDTTSLLGIVSLTSSSPGFYYSFLYCAAIVVFGIQRVRRRKTPYVMWQTISLAAIQCVPLFLLPYILLPWMGMNGWFDGGVLGRIADELFPKVDYGAGREYWRAFGLILAWPLFIWNVFTAQPMWGWLGISLVQTFVIIPALIYFYGKGVYCGWICSCGALAETVGDSHRTKMPHGPFWNRFNMVGQVFLWFAFGLLVLRVGGWIWPNGVMAWLFDYMLHKVPVFNYVWLVDLMWAGILGVALYWHFSGRVWCRFACPLAALMHIYSRFSTFRILAEKKKCISCNVCTSVCHQGIDVMNFANKGLPMADPQCVRCSACVQSCPTGVLSFGRADGAGKVLGKDPAFLAASPVQMREMKATLTINGKQH
jgi:thioredoxin reductase/Fe-S-cluster-containing hydrogenase component 2